MMMKECIGALYAAVIHIVTVLNNAINVHNRKYFGRNKGDCMAPHFFTFPPTCKNIILQIYLENKKREKSYTNIRFCVTF